MTPPKVDLKNRYVALILAWMVPGLGHVYQGRKAKGMLYGVCILSLFLAGLAMGDGKIYWRWVHPVQNSELFCFNYLGQFWAGLVALPALLQPTLKMYGYRPIPWAIMVEPSQLQINGLYAKGKLVEIGVLYTTIAGLLNILAMYDAFDGPAQINEPGPAAKSDRLEARASA